MENKHKRLLEWGQNLLILGLSLSAIVLISRSTLYEGFGILSNTKKEQQSVSDHLQTGEGSTLSVEPVCLAVQNEHGRYGVQYDSKTTHQLFEDKLGSLLREALSGVKETMPSTKEQWQAVVQGSGSWIYYNFSTSLPLENLPLWLGSDTAAKSLSGFASTFLLTNQDGTYLLYYYNEGTQTYVACSLADGSGERFLTAISDIPSNDAIFAFEDSKRFGVLNDNVLILPKVPVLAMYEVKNPIVLPDKVTQEQIMRALSFNPNAVTTYNPVDGIVLKEGTGTLRMFNNGTISYHGQESDPRFSVPENDVGAMIEQTQDLLMTLMDDRCGEAQPYLAAMETKENNETVLTYEYRLNGAPVKLYSEGYAAQFTIQGGLIRDFTIHIRQYLATEEASLILPEPQAAAAVKAKGTTGQSLRLAYLDTGEESRVAANWILE